MTPVSFFEREREKEKRKRESEKGIERERYIYIYIYIEIKRDTERERERERSFPYAVRSVEIRAPFSSPLRFACLKRMGSLSSCQGQRIWIWEVQISKKSAEFRRKPLSPLFVPPLAGLQNIRIDHHQSLSGHVRPRQATEI